ncbi:hypothetical protein D3C78_1759500 [compost metagenome]
MPCCCESSIALTLASSKLAPCSNTSPPKPRTASTLISAVDTGITIRVLIPKRLPEKATPCAWLPAEAVTTPRALCSSSRLAIIA